MSSSAERQRRLRERRRAAGQCPKCKEPLAAGERLCAACKLEIRDSVTRSKAKIVARSIGCGTPVLDDDESDALAHLSPGERAQVARMLKNAPAIPHLRVERIASGSGSYHSGWNPIREIGPRW